MRLSKSLIPLASLAMIYACGGTTDNGAATETRMDDLDSLEGTISDDAINTDRSTDEGPIEAAPATAPATETQQPKAATEKSGPDIMPVAAKTGDEADTE